MKLSKGVTSFKVLSSTHNRDHLLDHAEKNGVTWDKTGHEGVNWMRASRAISSHINRGNEFNMDDMSKESAQTMLDHYKVLRDHHKQTMIPHLRSAMAKLHSESGDPNSQPTDHLDAAHALLNNSANGVWKEKLDTLSHFNTQIAKLEGKVQGS